MKHTNLTYSKKTLGRGHWELSAHGYNEEKGIFEEKKFITSNSLLVDDAFNSDDGDTSFYDSVEDARQAIYNQTLGKENGEITS